VLTMEGTYVNSAESVSDTGDGVYVLLTGLRVSVILGACLVTLGAVLRCVADTPPAVLW
jgi:hypothetical protein